MLTKKITKKITAMSLISIMVVTMLGIGISVYASHYSQKQKALAASTDVEQPETEIVEQAVEVEEEVTQEEEEEYLKYLDEEEKKEEEEEKKETSNLPYYIKVNYRAQTVTVYGKDENGEYTKTVTVFICSTGTDTPTSGVYPLKAKYRWINLKGNVYGQYSSRIVGSILFHSVYYYEKFNPSTLCYTGYDRLGSKASAGCVRLNVAAAKWIYDNCPVGTKVEFYSSSNPGPLGKPSSPKISSNLECRGWDPTDPDPNNPWHTYVAPSTKPDDASNKEPVPTPVPEPEPAPTPVPEPNTGITDITLNKTEIELEEAKQEIIKVTINPLDADIESIEWKSSDKNIATVSDGVIKAVAKGEAIITVTVKDKDGKTVTKDCKVTVIEKIENNDINGVNAVLGVD